MSAHDHLSDRVLVCRVASYRCAIPLEHVTETCRPLPIEPIAGMPAFVVGLSVIRGTLAPVVDVATLLGAIGPVHVGRFVTLRVGTRRVALAVETVIGVQSVARDSLGELPPLLRDASAEVVASIGTLDRELLLVLRSGRIVTDSVWTAIDARKATA